MQTKIMSLFTRTPLHVGCGSSVGAVDQPVVRERHTGYPVIPGSSIKGVLADLWLDDPKSVKRVEAEKDGKKSVSWVRIADGEAHQLFGNDTSEKSAKAGALLIGEGKLAAFPVRSAKGCWAWLTCPLALGRLARDGGGAGAQPPSLVPPEGKAYADKALTIGGSVVFEEYPLEVVVGEAANQALAWAKELLKPLSDDPVWQDNLDAHLAIIDDDLFAYFAKNACEIANHNRIDDETGVVADGALFSQENVPSETMFYAPVSCVEAKCAGGFVKLETKVSEQGNKLQIGADATTGLGWCSVTFVDAK